MPSDSPSFCGVPIKYVSLVILIVQNSAFALTMRYSRIQPGPRYLSSTAVVISEVLKFKLSFAIYLYQQYNKQPSDTRETEESSSPWDIRQLASDIFSAKSGFLKLLIPVILYTLQNNLQFVAVSNLDAVTFQVTYQCKILTTAVFAVILLKKSLSWIKWLSLLMLTIGVGCIQIPSSGSNTNHHEGQYFVGIIAVTLACLCSGLAGVYFEKVLKTDSTTSIWARNIQLSAGCLVIAALGALMLDGQAILQDGFFHGYNVITVITICVQAAGGLIVAMVINYADNILKGFATSLSIILSTIGSIFIFDFVVTIYFLIGTTLVFLATYLYSKPDMPNATALTEEGVPMLNGEYYDEKPRPRFRDDGDIEAMSDKSWEASQTRSRDEERKICDVLGHIA